MGALEKSGSPNRFLFYELVHQKVSGVRYEAGHLVSLKNNVHEVFCGKSYHLPLRPQVVLLNKFSWEFLTAYFRRRIRDLMSHENFLRLQVQIVGGRYVDLAMPRLLFNNLASFYRIVILFLFRFLLAMIRDILNRASSLLTVWELMGLNLWICQVWILSTHLALRMNLHLCMLQILSAFMFTVLSL